MRHAPFPVTLDMRDRWMRHMLAALDTLDLAEAHAEQMRDYFLRAAHMLVNTDEDHPPRGHVPGCDAARAGRKAATLFATRHGMEHGAVTQPTAEPDPDRPRRGRARRRLPTRRGGATP